MGNAAAIQNVSDSSRRRLMLQQYNRQGRNVLVSHLLMQALVQRQSPRITQNRLFRQGINKNELVRALPLHEIYDVLKREFEVQLTREELPFALKYLGCRVVQPPIETTINLDPAEEWFSIQELIEYVAPRQISQQQFGCRDRSHDNTTIWQAAKMGDIALVEAAYGVDNEAYRALDDFGNSPLYYACLCGHVVVVDFVRRAYERECHEITPDELLRCVTNALNQHTRDLLLQKITLEEILLNSKKHNLDVEEFAIGAWFGLSNEDEK